MRRHELQVLVVLLQIVHYLSLITERAALASSIGFFMVEARSPGLSSMKHYM